MRLNKQPTRLRLEALESRYAPATINFSGSTLTVSNPSLPIGNTLLSITLLANNKVSVVENTTKNLGTYNVSNVVVNGSNAKDTINVNLGGFSLSGGLTVSSGNGDDTVNVNNGTIRGSFTFDGGNGNDLVRVANTTAVTVLGATTLSAGLGTSDQAQVGFGGAAALSGTLGFFGFNTFNYSIANTTLGSGLTFSDRITSSSGVYKLINSGTGTGTISVPGTFRADFGSGNSSLNINANFVGALIVTMGGGSDSLTIDTEVRNNAAVSFGSGDGSITIPADASFNTNKVTGAGLSIAMGEGLNSYSLNNTSVMNPAGFTVNGNLSLTTPANGTLDQTFAISALVLKTNPPSSADGNLTISTGFGLDVVTVNAILEGNLTAKLGQGDNVFVVSTDASYADLIFTAGDGNNLLNIHVPTPVGTHNITLTFGGGGANTVNFDIEAGITLSGGTITVNWNDGLLGDDIITSPTPPPFAGTGYTLIETGVQ